MPYRNKEQQQAYQRKWRRQRWKEWIDANGPCQSCGSSQNLTVDHVDPTIKITHRIWSYTLEKRLEELAKCQVLCWTCHKAKSIDFSKVKEHGVTMYKKYGCRCDICREARSLVRKAQYRRTGK